jgi:hypothetical protein
MGRGDHLKGRDPIIETWHERTERLWTEHALQDRLHTYWRQHWIYGNDEEAPFPFYVTVRDDEASIALLHRLDAMGLPYHINFQHPDDADVLSATIHAPLMDSGETGVPGSWFGFFPPEEPYYAPTVDDFFARFHPREG